MRQCGTHNEVRVNFLIRIAATRELSTSLSPSLSKSSLYVSNMALATIKGGGGRIYSINVFIHFAYHRQFLCIKYSRVFACSSFLRHIFCAVYLHSANVSLTAKDFVRLVTLWSNSSAPSFIHQFDYSSGESLRLQWTPKISPLLSLSARMRKTPISNPTGGTNVQQVRNRVHTINPISNSTPSIFTDALWKPMKSYRHECTIGVRIFVRKELPRWTFTKFMCSAWLKYS